MNNLRVERRIGVGAVSPGVGTVVGIGALAAGGTASYLLHRWAYPRDITVGKWFLVGLGTAVSGLIIGLVVRPLLT